MPDADTIRDAIRECFLAHPGQVLGISDVQGWVDRAYPARWKDISTPMADLAIDASSSSGYRPNQRFLERVARGRYRMPSAGAIKPDVAAVTATTPPTRTAPAAAEAAPASFWVPGIPSSFATKSEAPWRECGAHP